jgi:hypothetical protein
MTKRPWKEWAVDHVIKTEMCPGDMPPMGTPDDKVTHSEFMQSIQSIGTHKHMDCHFVPEILGVDKAVAGMEEVKIKENQALYVEKSDNLKDAMKEVSDSKRVAKLRENLHIYVERIEFKANGNLNVPRPLLNVVEYIQKMLT